MAHLDYLFTSNCTLHSISGDIKLLKMNYFYGKGCQGRLTKHYKMLCEKVDFTFFSKQTYDMAILLPVSHVRKLRCSKLNPWAYSGTDSKWQSQDPSLPFHPNPQLPVWCALEFLNASKNSWANLRYGHSLNFHLRMFIMKVSTVFNCGWNESCLNIIQKGE